MNYYPFGLKHKGYNNVVSSNGNSTAQKFGYANKELEEDLGLNTISYGWRDYDPALGRFNKIDRFAEKYVDATPYHFSTSNPIAIREIAGDSIKVIFQNKKGKQINTIPKEVQKMFNEEFGIKVGYNSKTNMLYFDGEVESDLSQSEDATNAIVSALKDTNTGKNSDKYGTVIFGYNMGGIKVGSVRGGEWTTTGGLYRKGVTQIDLADFDSEGKYKSFSYSRALNPRSLNLARTFEHEFLGHQATGRVGHGKVMRITNGFRRQRGLDERLNYDSYNGVIFFGSTQGQTKSQQRKAVRKMINGKMANDKFVKPKRN